MTHFRVITALTLATSLLLSLIILTPAPTLAAEATVTNCTEVGLAQAINDAGTTDPNNPGLVTFNCPNPTIIHTDQIFIGDDLLPFFAVIIDGSNNGNSSPITLDGQGSTRLFFVHDDGYLTIKNMTLQNGRTNVGYGGAIYNEGIVNVTQSTFTNNSSGYYGGAIHNENRLDVIQSVFINNRGRYGGAILNVGNVEITQSSFINNQAANMAGAIYAYNGTVDISSSTFSGNTAPIGSDIVIEISSSIATISWSTFNQAPNSSSALYIKDDLALEGVILGGDGQHCAFEGGTLTDAYTLATDDSCGLQGVGSKQNVANLGLGPLTTSTINGINQSYYPLLETSPAVDGSLTNICPASDDPDVMNLDQLGNPRPQSTTCDIGAIESPFTGSDVLCANRWTGQLQYTPGCNRSSQPALFSPDFPLTLCVNNWNSATRLSDHCTRSEHPITVSPTQTIPICINTWNHTIRATTHCTRSETADWL